MEKHIRQAAEPKNEPRCLPHHAGVGDCTDQVRWSLMSCDLARLRVAEEGGAGRAPVNPLRQLKNSKPYAGGPFEKRGMQAQFVCSIPVQQDSYPPPSPPPIFLPLMGG